MTAVLASLVGDRGRESPMSSRWLLLPPASRCNQTTLAVALAKDRYAHLEPVVAVAPHPRSMRRGTYYDGSGTDCPGPLIMPRGTA